jgi:hypothetical protein
VDPKVHTLGGHLGAQLKDKPHRPRKGVRNILLGILAELVQEAMHPWLRSLLSM